MLKSSIVNAYPYSHYKKQNTPSLMKSNYLILITIMFISQGVSPIYADLMTWITFNFLSFLR